MENKHPAERTTSVPNTVQSMATFDSEKKPSEIAAIENGQEGLLRPKESSGLGQRNSGSEEVDPLETDVQGQDVVHYKTLNWWHCGILMIAECISLGILSLPRAMAVLGLIPGLILIIGLGVIAGYTGYVIGQFKLKHPGCTSMADAGMILFGPIGRELFGIGQLIVLVFIMAAHITSFAIMMNVLTKHATCTIIFMLLGLLISILCTLPRTLKNISYFSIASCLSIFTAVFVVMVGVGVTKPNPHRMEMFGEKTSLVNGMNAVLNIVLAYSGHVTYFGFASELKRPKDFTKSLVMLQTTAIIAYTTCALVIYCYHGPNVPAPALSAAGPKVKLAAYGIASLTIIIAGVVNGSVGSKQIYLRFWQWKRQPKVVQEKSVKAWGSWVAIVVILWSLAWLIAEAIPRFEYVLALVAALFSGWYSFGITSILWLQMNRGRWLLDWRRIALTILNVVILGMGCVISMLGLYACGKAIHDGQSGKPFSCEDNSKMT